MISSAGSSTEHRYSTDSNDTSTIAIIIGLVVSVSIYVSLWLYFRGYKIIIKNQNTRFELLCRNRIGLLDLAYKIDLFRLSLENIPEIDFNNLKISQTSKSEDRESSNTIEKYSDKIESTIKNKIQAGKQKLHKMTAPVSGISLSTVDSLDQTCIKCNSVLTLEGNDLNQDSYTCPICSTINPVKR